MAIGFTKKKEKTLLSIGVVIIIIASLLLTSISGCYAKSVNTPKSAQVSTLSKQISITYPSDSATVQMKETLAGTAKKIPKGKHLWIAIYPQNAYKYYPQNPVTVQSDGSWTLPVQFGEEVHSGVKFDICAILADNNAHKELSKYIKASEKAKSWDGIKFLPRGTKIITKLTVKRA